MPMILTPQAPLRPTLRAALEWHGVAGSEILSVTVTDRDADGQETVVAEYDVHFAELASGDEWAGLELPDGVPPWADVVVSATRDADGRLTVTVVDWASPTRDSDTTVSFPWEGSDA